MKTGEFDRCEIVVERTHFTILSRKLGGLGATRFIEAVSLAWPQFQRILKTPVAAATLVDVDAPIGGGPMGDFRVGIYSSDVIKPEISEYLRSVLGWTPCRTTAGYIEEHYSNFADPTQAYVNDMVTHELGHLLFGFGATKAKTFSYPDAWFALGMGILYDRLVWNQFNAQASPMFDAIVEIWKEKFSNRKDVDQKLINPNESNDEKSGLNRMQTYGHGKAFVFLTALRSAVGIEAFDKAVVDYFSRPTGSTILYDEFLTALSETHSTAIKTIESQFEVR